MSTETTSNIRHIRSLHNKCVIMSKRDEEWPDQSEANEYWWQSTWLSLISVNISDVKIATIKSYYRCSLYYLYNIIHKISNLCLQLQLQLLVIKMCMVAELDYWMWISAIKINYSHSGDSSKIDERDAQYKTKVNEVLLQQAVMPLPER